MMYFIRQRLLIVALSACLLGMSACASSTALFEDMETLELGDQAIALVVVDAHNKVKPDSAPNLKTVRVVGEDNGIFTFSVPEPIELADGQTLRYLLSFRLPAGSFKLHSARGQNPINVSFDEDFVIPINRDFALSSGEFAYLGHIIAVNRERAYGEESAGELVVGEAYDSAGFAYGTFDVQISDRSETDISLFKQQYSVLQDRQVALRVLQDQQTVIAAKPELPIGRANEIEAAMATIAPEVDTASSVEHALPLHQREMRGALKATVKAGETSSVIKPSDKSLSKRKCSVDQILGMSKLGLNPEQIKEACN